MMAIAGEANQIFRELTKFDHGIDGEVEFKDNDGNGERQEDLRPAQERELVPADTAKATAAKSLT